MDARKRAYAENPVCRIWVPAFAGTSGCWADYAQPRRALVRAGILAPDSERFLRRAIGDREQHRFLPHPMGVMLPLRHLEHVVPAPFQHLADDRERALPVGPDTSCAARA